MEHLDLLRLNGFEVLVDEDADVGERVKLLAQPVSKDTVFGVEGELPPFAALPAPTDSVRSQTSRSCWTSSNRAPTARSFVLPRRARCSRAELVARA
jgi:DNA mismatch repair protein PMS2